MSDIITHTLCTECGSVTTTEPSYCPDCGGESPWVEEPRYDFEDVDLPVVFSVQHYDDHHGMWRSFTGQVFDVHELKGSQIANLPTGLPSMKHCVVELYYKLTENLELEGPYLEREEAQEA